MLMKVQSSLSLRVFTLGLRANNRSSQALGTMLPRRVSIDEARYCSPLGGSPWYVYFLVFLGLKLGSGVGWCEPERLILATRWSLGAKERP